MAPSAVPATVILTRRRCGASAVYGLMSQHVPWPCLGVQPFRWTHPLGEASRLFHSEKAVDAARSLLRHQLEHGVFFSHPYETESWAFNTLLLEELEAAKYRVLLVDRKNEFERLVSLFVAQAFDTWTGEAIGGLRTRLRGGEALSSVDGDAIRRMVNTEVETKRWFDAELGKHRIATLGCDHDALFRCGAAVLGLFDQLFAFAGIGSREAVLDDASLLRVVFTGDHHTPGLLAHDEGLRQAARLIQAELDRASLHVRELPST